jgi:hypothetical protein
MTTDTLNSVLISVHPYIDSVYRLPQHCHLTNSLANLIGCFITRSIPRHPLYLSVFFRVLFLYTFLLSRRQYPFVFASYILPPSAHNVFKCRIFSILVHTSPQQLSSLLRIISCSFSAVTWQSERSTVCLRNSCFM